MWSSIMNMKVKKKDTQYVLKEEWKRIKISGIRFALSNNMGGGIKGREEALGDMYKAKKKRE